MYCHNCGTRLSDNDKFCKKCGHNAEKKFCRKCEHNAEKTLRQSSEDKLSPFIKGVQILLYFIATLGVIETVVFSIQMKSAGLFIIMGVVVGIGIVFPTIMSSKLEREGNIRDAKTIIALTLIGVGSIIALVKLTSQASESALIKKRRNIVFLRQLRTYHASPARRLSKMPRFLNGKVNS